jgi:maltose O-acetyltransferase
MNRIIKYAFFYFIMSVTSCFPDFTPVLKLRGFLVGRCFKKCGANFQIASGVKINYTSEIEIGNNVYIASYCWFQGAGRIIIEDDVMFGPFVVLATNNHIYSAGAWRRDEGNKEMIVIRRGSWIAAHVVITSGVTVGYGSAVAAGAVVTSNVPDMTLVGGVPADVIKRM